MNILERNAEILMATENLARALRCEMPSGFAMRWYAPGDEKTWVAVQQAAERFQKIDEALFWSQYGRDTNKLTSRVGFLMNGDGCDGNEIGTISAWNDVLYNGREYGRIHWVAIVPEMQGRGLGKAMLSAACERLLELGHERAYLVTSTARIPAINLYRAFGFDPVMRDDQERATWEELMPYLK